ncbi:MAG: hypothetical protein P1S60_07075, partial [Anaerolineae bacterium]|nr:hypothetical protein [Anaerolineae bacterium]
MTELKKTNPRERKIVKGFDDWTDRIKSEAVLRRPDGDLIIPIQSLSDADRVEILRIYRDMTPARPKLVIDRNGDVLNNPVNARAEAEYEEQKTHAGRVAQMLYI